MSVLRHLVAQPAPRGLQPARRREPAGQPRSRADHCRAACRRRDRKQTTPTGSTSSRKAIRSSPRSSATASSPTDVAPNTASVRPSICINDPTEREVRDGHATSLSPASAPRATAARRTPGRRSRRLGAPGRTRRRRAHRRRRRRAGHQPGRDYESIAADMGLRPRWVRSLPAEGRMSAWPSIGLPPAIATGERTPWPLVYGNDGATAITGAPTAAAGEGVRHGHRPHRCPTA